MVNVLFLFPRSAETESLDDFIGGTMAPGLRRARGVRSVKVSTGDLMSPAGPPPYSRVVEVSFDSLPDVLANVEDPESQPARERIRSFGALVLTYDVAELGPTA